MSNVIPFSYPNTDATLLEVKLNAPAIKQKAKQIQSIAVACDDQTKVCIIDDLNY